MPLIVMTCNYDYPRGRSDTDFVHMVHAWYARGLAAAGGLPVLATGGDPEELAARADGLLLTGGADIDPAYFGETTLNRRVEINAARDRAELAQFQAFLRAGKPIFGICRGIQLLNVALGGDLWQDIPAQCPDALAHGGTIKNPIDHEVTALPGSVTAALCGEKFITNSFHHQAVRRLGEGLRATAHTADGIIEAVEHASLPVFGVQWHPERMTGPDCPAHMPDMGPLFTHFISSCKL